MIKIFSSAISWCLFLIAGCSATAQNKEMSFSVGGGISGLQYDVKNGAARMKPGFQAAIGYTHFLNAHWGIVSGIELGYYHTRATLTRNTVFAANTVDNEGSAFEFRVKTKGYEEKQSLYTVNIPLMLQFQTAAHHGTELYAQGGVKLGIPASNSYKTHADEISASGYYPDLNVEIADLPAHGFGTQTNWNKKGEYDFKHSCAVAAEAGAKFHLSPGHYLYAGAYIDYGLNKIMKEQGDASLLKYNSTAISQSQSTGMFSLANTTGNARLMAYGIKLRIGFGATKTK
jgi:OOP family OmpA-OmpF porin